MHVTDPGLAVRIEAHRREVDELGVGTDSK